MEAFWWGLGVSVCVVAFLLYMGARWMNDYLWKRLMTWFLASKKEGTCSPEVFLAVAEKIFNIK